MIMAYLVVPPIITEMHRLLQKRTCQDSVITSKWFSIQLTTVGKNREEHLRFFLGKKGH